MLSLFILFGNKPWRVFVAYILDIKNKGFVKRNRLALSLVGIAIARKRNSKRVALMIYCIVKLGIVAILGCDVGCVLPHNI